MTVNSVNAVFYRDPKNGVPENVFEGIYDPSVFDNYVIPEPKDANKDQPKDGKDDGKISLWSKIKNFGKGVVNGVKGMIKGAIKHPIKTALAIGACCIPGVGPFVAVGLGAYGAIKGAIGIAKSAKAAKNATTDAEAEAAWQGIGTGSFQVGISVVAMKGGVKSIKANNAAAAEAGNSAIAENAGIVGKATGSFKNGINTFKSSNFGKTVIDKAADAKSAIKEGEVLKDLKGTAKSKYEVLKETAELKIARHKANKIDQNSGLTEAEVHALKDLELKESWQSDASKALEGKIDTIRTNAKSLKDTVKETAELKIARHKANKIDQNSGLTEAEIHALKDLELKEAWQSDASKAFESSIRNVRTTAKTAARKVRNSETYKLLKTPVLATAPNLIEDETQEYNQI